MPRSRWFFAPIVIAAVRYVSQQVDGAAEPELAKSHGIQGYPALLVFHAGADAKVPKPYGGTTTTAGFIEYLNKVGAPLVVVVVVVVVMKSVCVASSSPLQLQRHVHNSTLAPLELSTAASRSWLAECQKRTPSCAPSMVPA